MDNKRASVARPFNNKFNKEVNIISVYYDIIFKYLPNYRCLWYNDSYLFF